LGYNALGANTTGSFNTALGNFALYLNTTVSGNTAVGYQAGYSNTTGSITAYGAQAGYSNTTGGGNVAIGGYDGFSSGAAALYANTTGNYNTAVGSGALRSNTTASSNTAVGAQAMRDTTTGANNVAFGVSSLNANTTGTQNVAVGSSALQAITTASENTAVGYQAGFSNTTSYNTFLGHKAGYGVTTGQTQVGIGRLALGGNSAGVTGADNVAIGNAALYVVTSGSNNIGIGTGALTANTTGVHNVAVGHAALTTCATSNNNTAVGYQAAQNITGGDITAIGWQAGNNVTSGGGSTFVGKGTQASSGSATNEIVVATSNVGTAKGSNTGFINPNSGGVYQGNNSSTWSTTSDRRLKKNIVDNNSGLEKIAAIQVRNFEYRLPEEVDAELKPTDAVKKEGVQLGAIAQELQQVLPDCVKTESTGVMSVNTDNLTWYLINAVKELKAEVDSLKSQLKGA
jgi:hypothetical protein